MISIPLNAIKTDYGFKKPGQSHFVIIAPHAAGDDLKTGLVARRLAKKLNGYLIVNQKYCKATNMQAPTKPQQIEDFNRLSWSQKKQKYLWQNKKSAMKKFFDDIAAYCDLAKNYSANQRACVVYLHGMQEPMIGLDIGAGLKSIRDKNIFVNAASSNNQTSGTITIRISQLKTLKNLFENQIKKYNLKVSIGKKYIGWSRRSAIQFHHHGGRHDDALQIEINKFLREKKQRKELIYFLADTLIKTFSN